MHGTTLARDDLMSGNLPTAAVLLGVLAAASVVGAQAPPEPGLVAPDPSRSYETATGTLEAYEPRTRVITVRSATGSSEFHVATDARFWLGRRRLPVSQLSAHTGEQVTVAWSERDGVRTTHTVRVTDPKPAREK
jgi:hypothetical protein